MTLEQFINLKNRIKNDKTSVKTNWYDGYKWTDAQGNWYGWTDCGYCKYIFYAGERYTSRTLCINGKMETFMVDE